MNTEKMVDALPEENELIVQRRKKLDLLRQGKSVAFPNDFRCDSFTDDLHRLYDQEDNETLLEAKHQVHIAGRMMLRRQMGRASFAHIQDMFGRIQLYLRENELGEAVYEAFQDWDLGDILGVSGYLFKTKTGELSVHVESIRLLSKAIRQLPDKFHGLVDKETCYRQRYIDLIVNEETRRTFLIRAQLIDGIRAFLNRRRFIEVETPMMQVLPGGATARPFVTHHNALDMSLYLRIAPELYLKRLVVGGFERVFEINRNFRNEGMSVKHNPEFTMLEFYQAYAVYTDLMDLTETLFRELAENILGQTTLTYQGHELDLGKPFQRLTVTESIVHFYPDIAMTDLNDIEKATRIAEERFGADIKPIYGLGRIQMEIFDAAVEHKLIQPTFITAYPAEVSPLARRNDDNPFITDRFELFVVGRELANGFSELNDPEDQAERFKQQVAEKDAGDDEAMYYDADYITALEHGMPPTAGEGIGIDRLAMLFTDSPSIRDVILFPQMRPAE